jgi:hypothetical protein
VATVRCAEIRSDDQRKDCPQESESDASSAVGMLVCGSLKFEDLVAACEEEGRYEFMASGSRFGFRTRQDRRGIRSRTSEDRVTQRSRGHEVR